MILMIISFMYPFFSSCRMEYHWPQYTNFLPHSFQYYEYFWNIFKIFFHLFTAFIFREAQLRGIIFSRISEKPLKSSKCRATRKSRNIFIPRYGTKTADSTAGVLFACCSQENAISSRWKSLTGQNAICLPIRIKIEKNISGLIAAFICHSPLFIYSVCIKIECWN